MRGKWSMGLGLLAALSAWTFVTSMLGGGRIIGFDIVFLLAFICATMAFLTGAFIGYKIGGKHEVIKIKASEADVWQSWTDQLEMALSFPLQATIASPMDKPGYLPGDQVTVVGLVTPNNREGVVVMCRGERGEHDLPFAALMIATDNDDVARLLADYKQAAAML